MNHYDSNCAANLDRDNNDGGQAVSNLSIHDIAKALSEHEYHGCLDWYVVKLNGDEDVVCGVGMEEYLSIGEAIDILAELEADA